MRVRRRDGFAVIFMAAAASGCITTGDGLTRFSSEPPGAVVTIKGHGECLTPCTAQLDETVNVTVAKTGYVPQDFQVKPRAKTINIELELAASSEDVEETALPDL